jgi:hypothetical protein
MTPMQLARLAVIDTANARMVAEKTAALDAYARVHPAGHQRCTDACRVGHRALLDALDDANAAYSAAIPRD